ncbi:methyltransferase domain-containing protein [Brevibacillus invocatus]|nr:methyltransferase domain-containing protein [Brevibacillus invocatus]
MAWVYLTVPFSFTKKRMKVMYAKSLLCSSGHCFDLAKQGYVNLLTRPHKTKYDSQLFEARQKVSISGFFEPLISHISERIPHMMKPSCDMIRMLDAGCGEGSHLTAIQNRILARTNLNIFGVGVDISKEGIRIAARSTSDIWCVGDLAHCPFKDQSFHVILNLLSPSNYSDFRRYNLSIY